jgi:hypothetical protein
MVFKELNQIELGPLNLALVAGPESPENPAVPEVPATFST